MLFSRDNGKKECIESSKSYSRESFGSFSKLKLKFGRRVHNFHLLLFRVYCVTFVDSKGLLSDTCVKKNKLKKTIPELFMVFWMEIAQLFTLGNNLPGL